MKQLIRKWLLQVKRRRYHRQLRQDGNYKTLENRIRETGTLCSNCNAPLTGPFCHICGQKDDDLKRPIWSLLREILDDVFSTDSRLFKTLILLALVPGGLTRAFRQGRRARFVPPLRLYIVMSILFFLIIAVADILILDINVRPREPETPPAVEQPAEPPADASGEEVTKQPATVPDTAAAPTTPEALDEEAQRQKEVQEKLANATMRLRETLGDNFAQLSEDAQQRILDVEAGKAINTDEFKAIMEEAEEIDDMVTFDVGFPYHISVQMFVANTGEIHEGLKQEDIDEVLNREDVPEFVKEATRGFAKALKDPEAFNELFNDWLPRAMFVLMPFFALLLRLFHWGKDRVYLQQFVFALHFHTFLFMLMMAMMVIVPRFGGDMGLGIFWWGTSLYLFIALKVGQEQGWIRAFFKAGFIWVTYFVVMVSVLLGAVFIGLREL
ncbi:MAG: DUF3667 domain-containing protein [Alphaproteobacteria bacterium]|nr:DUF3667 domain-containing protein [Alphaproteobacteria bacterium]